MVKTAEYKYGSYGGTATWGTCPTCKQRKVVKRQYGLGRYIVSCKPCHDALAQG